MFHRIQVILAEFLWTPFYWSMFIFKNIAQYRSEYPSNGLPTGMPSMENYCFNNLAHLTHEGPCAETLLFETVTLPFAPQAVFETMSDVNVTDVLIPLILDPYPNVRTHFHPILVTYGRSFRNEGAQSKFWIFPMAASWSLVKTSNYQLQKRLTNILVKH